MENTENIPEAAAIKREGRDILYALKPLCLMITARFKMIAANTKRMAVHSKGEKPVEYSLFTNIQELPQNTPAKIIKNAESLFFIKSHNVKSYCKLGNLHFLFFTTENTVNITNDIILQTC